ncbi:MAG: hypothetical protein LAP21_23170 [Acidobacteriia bacterium]|nr:hypothetical protein [Terriglobia bacterium]
MPAILLLCAMLFLGAPQTTPKPLIENDRVAVWEVTGSNGAAVGYRGRVPVRQRHIPSPVFSAGDATKLEE